MVRMTLPQLFIWAVILVALGQLYLIARYLLRPRIQRITHCPWCWQDAGIGSEYPRPWSSTICPYHDRRIREQSRAHRLTKQRRAAPTTSAVTGGPKKREACNSDADRRKDAETSLVASSPTPIRVSDQKRGIVTIAVHIEGTYRFSQDELHQIERLIAGKTQQQAIRILLGLPGI